jgi:hypothetical protein
VNSAAAFQCPRERHDAKAVASDYIPGKIATAMNMMFKDPKSWTKPIGNFTPFFGSHPRPAPDHISFGMVSHRQLDGPQWRIVWWQKHTVG